MYTVTLLDSSPNYTSLHTWNNLLTDAPAATKMGLDTAESLPTGCGQPWRCWRSLNRVRTRICRAKTTTTRWRYIDNTQSYNCDCGEPQTMAHLLCCRLLDEPCSSEDLITVIERAKACAGNDNTLCEGHDRRHEKHIISVEP